MRPPPPRPCPSSVSVELELERERDVSGRYAACDWVIQVSYISA